MATSCGADANSSWMENMPPQLRCQPLKNIAIPGSHNSFSYSLKVNSPVSPCSPDTIRNLVSVFGKTACKIVHNWSVTQTLTIKEQLNCGIRYLDLRVATSKTEEGLFFVHGLYGCSVETGLGEIKDWVDNHPNEILLLDFNHLYNMEVKDHQYLTQQLQEKFGRKLCPVIDVENVALNVLCEQNWNVIVFYHNNHHKENNSLWAGSRIPSPWPNTPEPTKMVNFLEANHTRGRDTSKFHVTQGILTPTGTTILQHIKSTLKGVFSVPAMKNLQFYLKDKKAGPSNINIVIADFVEMDGFIDCVLAMNNST
ncbi:PI-PLC X domain-containing protein 3-like [Antedon mediterranea]|uniref:PI-PLC X domain-containing protein 3-like n=1 Tax=Antedon mediterranea TaxID=105859 RepID=UPI003AF98BD9